MRDGRPARVAYPRGERFHEHGRTSPHMSRHLIDLLDELRTRVARMSGLVQQIVERAVDAVLHADPELARTTIELDERIDEEEVKVEQAAIDLLALHQPA